MRFGAKESARHALGERPPEGEDGQKSEEPPTTEARECPTPFDRGSRLSMLPCPPAYKSWAIRLSNGAQRDIRWNSGWPEVSRSLLIAVIGVEPVALIVLDAPQRRGIHLVQDHAQDSIQ